MTSVLLDSSNMICRAYYGRANQDARAVPLVLRHAVAALRAQYQPDHVIAALDDHQNFRQALYPTYKGQRPAKPADLEALLNDAATLMRGAGTLPALATNHEADDVLGTLAHRAPGQVVIVTSDRDLYSVISEHIHVHDPRQNARITASGVSDRYGVPPSRIPLLKSLAGDASDNIPGVRGLGEKSAAFIAAQCASVDEVFTRLPTFQRRHQQALLAARAEDVHLFFELATVRLDAPVIRVPTR